MSYRIFVFSKYFENRWKTVKSCINNLKCYDKVTYLFQDYPDEILSEVLDLNNPPSGWEILRNQSISDRVITNILNNRKILINESKKYNIQYAIMIDDDFRLDKQIIDRLSSLPEGKITLVPTNDEFNLMKPSLKAAFAMYGGHILVKRVLHFIQRFYDRFNCENDDTLFNIIAYLEGFNCYKLKTKYVKQFLSSANSSTWRTKNICKNVELLDNILKLTIYCGGYFTELGIQTTKENIHKRSLMNELDLTSLYWENIL